MNKPPFSSELQTLDARLLACSALWCSAHDAKPGRLGRLVVNDGGFFTRLEAGGTSTTTATLEKFARFLIDPANWPADPDVAWLVPDEVIAFCHAVGVSSALPAASSGKSGEFSPERVA